MKVIVLGGTRFIGRATVEELAAAGDELMVVHRGELEPDDLPDVQHLHCDRSELAAHRDELATFGPDALVDCRALSRADAQVSLEALPEVGRRIVISSMDVYRAFGALLQDRETDPVPIDEQSPVRVERYPYRGRLADRDDYDKLDVEDVYLPRGALVLRLPMVYGEHDYQLREEFILRRVRAGRQRIPIGAGSWLACRAYVRDVARAVRLALHAAEASGVMNICEDRTYSMRMWASPARCSSTSRLAPARPGPSSGGRPPIPSTACARRCAGTSSTHPPIPTQTSPRTTALWRPGLPSRSKLQSDVPPLPAV